MATTAPKETLKNLKLPLKVLERAKAVKEADRVLSGRSTTLIDIVNIGIKHIEDEHRRLRSSSLMAPNGHHRRRASDAKIGRRTSRAKS